jgi:hypothetical protein
MSNVVHPIEPDANDALNVEALLQNMFSDGRFRRTRQWCWSAVIDGVRIGVVAATKNPPGGFYTFIANQRDLESLLAAKSSGRVDHAWVVAASTNGDGTFLFVDAFDAFEVHDKLKDQPTRMGRNGPFWIIDHVVNIDDQWGVPL